MTPAGKGFWERPPRGMAGECAWALPWSSPTTSHCPCHPTTQAPAEGSQVISEPADPGFSMVHSEPVPEASWQPPGSLLPGGLLWKVERGSGPSACPLARGVTSGDGSLRARGPELGYRWCRSLTSHAALIAAQTLPCGRCNSVLRAGGA